MAIELKMINFMSSLIELQTGELFEAVASTLALFDQTRSRREVETESLRLQAAL